MRLDVRLEQFDEPIGVLESTAGGAVAFGYDPAYAARPDAMPISLALPLRADAFSDPDTRAFFDNLLPENDQLREVMDRDRIARDDVVGLLARLGADCPGAISCLPEGEPPQKIPGLVEADYDPIDQAELTEIVRRLAAQEPVFDHRRDPSPLAGVQRKIALTALGGGVFGLPKVGAKAPTTHILKAPRIGRGREAALEAAAAELAAAALGLPVAVPHAIDFDGVSALIVERFDRRVAQGRVMRVHQEDFAQALSLPARMKYERYGAGDRRYAAAAVAALLDRTAEPAKAKWDFALATLFNLCIGNTDNHAKNHALIYSAGPVPRFAPLYDLLPTMLDPSLSHDLSLRIGVAETFEDIAFEDVGAFLSAFGLRPTGQRRFLEARVAPTIARLDAAATALTAHGLKDFDDLIGSQLTRFVDVARLAVTPRGRDYFASKAGGWGLGS